MFFVSQILLADKICLRLFWMRTGLNHFHSYIALQPYPSYTQDHPIQQDYAFLCYHFTELARDLRERSDFNEHIVKLNSSLHSFGKICADILHFEPENPSYIVTGGVQEISTPASLILIAKQIACGALEEAIEFYKVLREEAESM